MTLVKARDLHTGMVIDLAGDHYANTCSDPDCGCDGDPGESSPWEYSYGLVTMIEFEMIAPNYPVVVTFEADGGEYVIAFPREHELRRER